MYYIKNRMKFKSQVKAAEEIGIAKETLSRILNGKVGTSKMTAYCIVKCFDKEAEIEDYFKKGE